MTSKGKYKVRKVGDVLSGKWLGGSNKKWLWQTLNPQCFTHWRLQFRCFPCYKKQDLSKTEKQPGKGSPKMVGEAKPMLETFVDYYNHVMVDLRDPRFMNVNDISDALCTSIIDPIQLAIGNCMLQSSWNLSFVIPSSLVLCNATFTVTNCIWINFVGSIFCCNYFWINCLLQLDQFSFAGQIPILSCRRYGQLLLPASPMSTSARCPLSRPGAIF